MARYNKNTKEDALLNICEKKKRKIIEELTIHFE